MVTAKRQLLIAKQYIIWIIELHIGVDIYESTLYIVCSIKPVKSGNNSLNAETPFKSKGFSFINGVLTPV